MVVHNSMFLQRICKNNLENILMLVYHINEMYPDGTLKEVARTAKQKIFSKVADCG